eukprot:766203-Hanusia_phi.AAC.10
MPHHYTDNDDYATEEAFGSPLLYIVYGHVIPLLLNFVCAIIVHSAFLWFNFLCAVVYTYMFYLQLAKHDRLYVRVLDTMLLLLCSFFLVMATAAFCPVWAFVIAILMFLPTLVISWKYFMRDLEEASCLCLDTDRDYDPNKSMLLMKIIYALEASIFMIVIMTRAKDITRDCTRAEFLCFASTIVFY